MDPTARELTPAQTARALGVTVARVRQLILRDELPARMTPLGRLILAEDLEKLQRLRETRRREREQAAQTKQAQKTR